MKESVYHREQNWRDIRKDHPVVNIDNSTASGMDGAYEKDGKYKAIESKYRTARIEDTSTGRELSTTWNQNHIDNGAIPNEADRIAMDRANRNRTLEREVIYTDKTEGSGAKTKTRKGLSSEIHDADGSKATRGQFEHLEMKPVSKAGQFINNTRSSIRNSKVLQALSNSEFSKGIQSSKAVVKANNGLWKATQCIEASPGLKTAGKVIGKGAIVVGIALDVWRVGSAYEEEGKFGDKMQQATGSALGGAAGAWAGAEIGAIIGTAICPGVGTVIGGILGGIIGGLAGSSAGSDLADWMF